MILIKWEKTPNFVHKLNTNLGRMSVFAYTTHGHSSIANAQTWTGFLKHTVGCFFYIIWHTRQEEIHLLINYTKTPDS